MIRCIHILYHLSHKKKIFVTLFPVISYIYFAGQQSINIQFPASNMLILAFLDFSLVLLIERLFHLETEHCWQFSS